MKLYSKILSIVQYCLWLILFLGMTQSFAQVNIPSEYGLLYEMDFDSNLPTLDMTDPTAWRITDIDGNKVLDLFGESDYAPVVRSPLNIALIKDRQFGSFILEVDLKQTGREYGHRDMCFFFGVKDPFNFYYVHMASIADPNAHNIFLVNDAPRTNIATKTTDGSDWGQEWHKVRFERSIEEGTIRVFFDDMKNPIMVAQDNHFGLGYIGFGSFDDTGMIDNIKIWGTESIEGDSFFR